LLTTGSFETFGNDVIQCFYDVATISGEPIRRRALMYVEQLAQRWKHSIAQRGWKEEAQPKPQEVIDAVIGMYCLERLGVPHRLKAEVLQFTNRSPENGGYTAKDYLKWDPAEGPPPTDIVQDNATSQMPGLNEGGFYHSCADDQTPHEVALLLGVDVKKLIALNVDRYKDILPKSKLKEGTLLLLPCNAEVRAVESVTRKVGDKVEAQFKGKGKHYPGKVKAVNADGTYSVLFDDGDKDEAVADSNIKSSGGNGGPRRIKTWSRYRLMSNCLIHTFYANRVGITLGSSYETVHGIMTTGLAHLLIFCRAACLRCYAGCPNFDLILDQISSVSKLMLINAIWSRTLSSL
jgi:hypothetical protein